MFRLMLQKMWHKKWMNICLILGCILLSATVVSFPIYKNAAYNRMLTDDFKNYTMSKGKWPTLLKSTVSVNKEKSGKTLKRMNDLPAYVYDKLGVEETDTFLMTAFAPTTIYSETGREDGQNISIRFGMLENIEEHSKILAGEMYSESGLTEDGAIECIISQSCLTSKGMLVGEYLSFTDLTYPDGSPIRIYIKGVFDALPDSGYYWQNKPESMKEQVFCNPELFKEYFEGEDCGEYNFVINEFMLFDYKGLNSSNLDEFMEASKFLLEESPYKSVLKDPDYTQIVKDYRIKESRIYATLIILQVPILAMLATFLFMISGQMYEMEKNEISVIKSRGSSKAQIIRLYFYQSVVITIIGGAFGLPLGALFARILGATKNFLEFDFNGVLDVSYTKETFVYLAGAILVCLLSITIPSIKHSKVSIVNLKQSKALKRKAWWQKLYLDFVLLGVSGYGYYSFTRDSANLSTTVLSGESLDPLLYISSSLFILGAGLFFLRLQPYLVKLIYVIGKNHWGPASHVSFMENTKNGIKQQLIMIFLIMTISLGMYHATVARTILDNAIENTEYLTGADVIVKENWTVVVDEHGNASSEYIAPDYTKYNSLDAAERFTKVIRYSSGYFASKDGGSHPVTLMGIHTKEFGKMTMIDSDLLDKHYYEYLNDLAVVENGVLVSPNFHNMLGYEVGDSITYLSPRGSSITGKIVGFMEYFPTYTPVVTGIGADGTAFTDDNYLIVTHYDYLVNKCGVTPYEVWIDLKDGSTTSDINNWINENKLIVTKYVNRADNVETVMQDPLLQGTNGVLTMGFVVTLILCAVGYLIYWVMSIRERELMFGVLRATGLHKSEIFTMLINEQIFSGLFSVLAGIGIGKLTSTLFVPILQQAYASKDQALPMRLIMVSSDMFRLYGVIAAVMVLVLFVLIFILSRMNVTKALKLGEE